MAEHGGGMFPGEGRIPAILGRVLLLLLISGMAFALHSLKQGMKELEAALERQGREVLTLGKNQDILKEFSTQTSRYANFPAPDFAGEKEEQENLHQTGNFELAAYDALSFLASYEQELANKRSFAEILMEPGFQTLLKKEGLNFKKDSGLKGTLSSETLDFFTLEFMPEDKSLVCSAVWEKGRYSGKSFSDLEQFIQEKSRDIRLCQAMGLKINRELPELYRDKAFRNALRKQELILGKLEGKPGAYVIPVLRLDESRVFDTTTSTASSSFIFADKSCRTLEEMKKGILEYAREHDLRSPGKIRDELAQEELKRLYEDPAFKQRLQDLGYRASLVPREDNDYIYYDLTDASGRRRGALALQKGFSEFYLMDGEDVPVRSLKSFTPEHELSFSFDIKSSGLPVPAVAERLEGQDSILFIGSHEHNADTMILAYLDGPGKSIKLLSIPRDLYYEGQKINALYRHAGPAALAEALSAITGLDIRKYAAVDMYAFIDLINILGGVDIHLDEALVDPTYKVRENGRWTTLYYPPGTYHLDGIAALRIARSRHTSSDFSRSVRQEKVISALKEKTAAMNITDLNKLYEIIQVVRQYLDTNLSTPEMVKYVLAARDYTMEGQYVMNTNNILYATYTNLYKLTPEEQERALEDEHFHKGGWIVLPLENDWNIIKQFVRRIFALPQ